MKFKIIPIAGDASFRTFYRISSKKKSTILVSTQKEKYKNLTAYSAINKFLREKKILTPKTYLFDFSKGVMIIEDFGDLSFNKVIAKNKNKLKIYKKKSSHPGNTWRKRSKEDGKIDWRMSTKSINNLTRALTPPYPYAYFVYKRKEMSVIKTKIILNKNKYFNIEPGRIVLYQGVNPVVKCADGLIKLYVKNKNFKPKKGESLN